MYTALLTAIVTWISTRALAKSWRTFNTQRECRLPIGILRVMRQGGRLNDRSGEPKCRTRSSSSLELEVKPNSSLDFANRG